MTRPRGSIRTVDPAEQRLLARLLDEDPTAAADLAEAYLPPLVAVLRRRYPQVDPHLAETAAIDAVLSVAERPAQVDLARLSLTGYLAMSARGDLLNALKRSMRQQQRESALDSFEQSDLDRKLLQGALAIDPVGDSVATSLAAAEARARIDSAVADPVERKALELMISGERRTGPYAALLGIEHLSQHDQEHAVKKLKDRLTKRLARLKGELGVDE